MAYDLPTIDQGLHLHDANRGRFVVDTLLRHWVLILISTALCGAAGGFIGAAMHEARQEYHAETDLVVRATFWQSPALASLGGNVFGDVTPTILVNHLDMNALARDVAEALVQDDIAFGRPGGGLTDDNELEQRAKGLLGAISLEPYDDRGLLRVHVRSPKSFDDAALIADYTARVLVEHTQLQRADEQQQAYDIVRQQLGELRGYLDEAESRQWQFREKMGFQTHDQVWGDIERKNSELVESLVVAVVLRHVGIRRDPQGLVPGLPKMLGHGRGVIREGLPYHRCRERGHDGRQGARGPIGCRVGARENHRFGGDGVDVRRQRPSLPRVPYRVRA